MRYLLTLIISLAFTLYLPAQNNGPHPDNRLEAQNEPKKFDPAAEAKNKIIFFVVVVALLIAGKFIFNF